ncbi:MAG: RyR domain-containing protein [Faecousia sp.]
MKQNWYPQPLDLADISLPEGLSELIEGLAENVHNEWAMERLQNGWTYGPERNDSRKQTPMLVPYQALPEEEKSYDRNTVLATLRGIRYFGFTVVSRQETGGDSPG